MLRITRLSLPGSPPTLKLEGDVVGPWVAELRGVVEAALADASRVVLDLSNVTFVDRPGLELLRAIGSTRAELRGGSSYVVALLEEPGHARAR